MSWQRRARLGLAVFAVLFVLFVAFSLRQRNRPAVPLPPRQDPAAVVESGAGFTVSTEGPEQNWRVDYQRMLRYSDGTTRFVGAKVTLPPREGKVTTLAADEAVVKQQGSPSPQQQQRIDMRGHVTLGSSDGFAAHAADASYDSTDGVVRVPGELTFSRGRMSGRAVGATYDGPRDVLWLLAHATVKVAPDAAGAGASDMAARSAGFARHDRYIRLLGGARIARDTQVMHADSATVFLQPQVDIIHRLELRGHSSVTTASVTPGTLQSMAATDMNLAYAADGRTLQQAVLAGGSVVQMAGAAGQPGRRLAGQYLDMALAPDGYTLTGLAARDAVQVDLPAGPGTPARSIRSATLAASGPSTGLTAARFQGGVEFRELQAVHRNGQPAGDRIVTAQSLEIATQPGLGNVDRATFSGAVKLREGAARDGAAEFAVYDVVKGVLALSSPGQSSAGARVSDDQGSVEAVAIDLGVDSDRLNAKGRVSSVLKARRPGDKTQQRPVMFRENEPVLATADALASTGSTAVYEGHARLWQGATAIVSDTLTLEQESGNLKASGNVRSTFALEQTDDKTRAKDGRLTTIAAADLVYTDANRQAVYTGKPHMVGPEGDLTATRIELYLDDQGRRLERLEAHEQVSIHTVEAGSAAPRHGRGTRLTYHAADGKYVMRGAPVIVVEQLSAECRETTGSVLTFYRSTDSISVDGNEGSRTQTRSGGRCPERAF